MSTEEDQTPSPAAADVDDCSICLEPCVYEQTRPKIVRTKCQHSFHESCLGNWLKTGTYVCPNCRHQFWEDTNENEPDLSPIESLPPPELWHEDITPLDLLFDTPFVSERLYSLLEQTSTANTRRSSLIRDLCTLNVEERHLVYAELQLHQGLLEAQDDPTVRFSRLETLRIQCERVMQELEDIDRDIERLERERRELHAVIEHRVP